MAISDRCLRILYNGENGNEEDYNNLQNIRHFLLGMLTKKARVNNTYYADFDTNFGSFVVKTRPETYELIIWNTETEKKLSCGNSFEYSNIFGSQAIDVAILKTILDNPSEENALSCFQKNYELSKKFTLWNDYAHTNKEIEDCIKNSDDVDTIILHRIVSIIYKNLVPIRNHCAENIYIAKLLPQSIDDIIASTVMETSLIGDRIYKDGIQSVITQKLRSGLMFDYKHQEENYKPKKNIGTKTVETSNNSGSEVGI